MVTWTVSFEQSFLSIEHYPLWACIFLLAYWSGHVDRHFLGRWSPLWYGFSQSGSLLNFWPDHNQTLSLGGFNSWSPLCGTNGSMVWPWFGSGGSRVSFSKPSAKPFIVWLDESRYLPRTNRCIMHIIFAIYSFICMNLATLTSKAKGSLVDIFLAQDLVLMGSRCDGNLDCFLWAIFSLYWTLPFVGLHLFACILTHLLAFGRSHPTPGVHTMTKEKSQ